jgi:hypothetical protein
VNENEFSRDETKRIYESRLGRSLKPNLQGQVNTRCPFHEDRNPSLSVNVATGQWNCHAGCGGGSMFEFEMRLHHVDYGEARARILQAIGRPLPPQVAAVQRQIAATYPYVDEQGQLLYEAVRYKPKGFAQRRPDPRGGWIWNMQGVRQVPYRLPGLLKAAEVIVCEGEKDADRLVAEGFAATTNSGGAGKWRTEFAEFFNDKQVVVIPDNDAPGQAHADVAARNLHSIASSVKVLNLPGLPLKGDASDWFDQGHTADELRTLIGSANLWTPTASSTSLLALIPNLWTVDAPTVDWAVQDLIPLGCVTLVSGAPDAGKTWFGLAMSRYLLQSEEFLGRRVSRRAVVYCDLENPLGVIMQRIEDLGFREDLDFHHWSFHCPVLPPPLTDATPYVQLAESLAVKPVLIFDSLVRFHDAGNENSASDMAAIMSQLRRIARTGAGVLVLHHRGKSESSQYRGSSDIQAGVDLSLMLDKDKKDGLLRLSTTKNRLGEPFEITMRLEPQSGGFAVTEDPDRERARQELNLVRGVIEQTPGLCQDEVVKKLRDRVPMGRVRQALTDGNGTLWHVRPGPHNRMDYFAGPAEMVDVEL